MPEGGRRARSPRRVVVDGRCDGAGGLSAAVAETVALLDSGEAHGQTAGHPSVRQHLPEFREIVF